MCFLDLHVGDWGLVMYSFELDTVYSLLRLDVLPDS